MIDWHGVTRAERRRVRFHHRMQVEMLTDLRQDRHAQLPATMRDHEVDRVGRRLLSRTDEVAFVLAVFSVDDNSDSPLADRVDRFFNSRKSMTQTVPACPVELGSANVRFYDTYYRSWQASHQLT